MLAKTALQRTDQTQNQHQVDGAQVVKAEASLNESAQNEINVSRDQNNQREYDANSKGLDDFNNL